MNGAMRTRGSGLTEYVIHSKKALLIKSNVRQWLRDNKVTLVGASARILDGRSIGRSGKGYWGDCSSKLFSSFIYNAEPRPINCGSLSKHPFAIDNARLFSFQQALIASVPHPVIAVDRRGRVTHLNEAAEKIVGETGPRIIGPSCIVLFIGGGLSEARRVEAALEDPAVRRNIEAFIRSVGGGEDSGSLVCSPNPEARKEKCLVALLFLKICEWLLCAGRVGKLFSAIEALNASSDLGSILEDAAH